MMKDKMMVVTRKKEEEKWWRRRRKRKKRSDGGMKFERLWRGDCGDDTRGGDDREIVAK